MERNGYNLLVLGEVCAPGCPVHIAYTVEFAVIEDQESRACLRLAYSLVVAMLLLECLKLVLTVLPAFFIGVCTWINLIRNPLSARNPGVSLHRFEIPPPSPVRGCLVMFLETQCRRSVKRCRAPAGPDARVARKPTVFG